MKNNHEIIALNNSTAIKVIREHDLANNKSNAYELFLDYLKETAFCVPSIFKSALKNSYIAKKDEFFQFIKEIERHGLNFVCEKLELNAEIKIPFGEKNPIRQIRKDNTGKVDDKSVLNQREEFEAKQKEIQRKGDIINFIEFKAKPLRRKNVSTLKEPIKTL